MKNFIPIVAFSIILGACKSSSGSTVSQSEGAENQPEGITEKYWKLVEINGKPVILDEASKGAFIILKNVENRVNGSGGCNTLTGTYQLDAAVQRIKFLQMVSTMMACLNMDVENELKRVLETADSYALSPDGKNLFLNRARMAPLAKFEVVYLE